MSLHNDHVNDGAQTNNHVATKQPRPSLHITDHSWINDPCAPGYDPKTGLYHLFYQCKVIFTLTAILFSTCVQ